MSFIHKTEQELRVFTRRFPILKLVNRFKVNKMCLDFLRMVCLQSLSQLSIVHADICNRH